MKIKSISLSNSLGFPPSGLLKDEDGGEIYFEDFNLIIGKNDSGKSNLIRSLVAIYFILNKWSEREVKNVFDALELSSLPISNKILQGKDIELLFYNKQDNPINFTINFYLSEEHKKELYDLPVPEITSHKNDSSNCKDLLKLSGEIFKEPNKIVFRMKEIELHKEKGEMGELIEPVYTKLLDVIQKDLGNPQHSSYLEFIMKVVKDLNRVVYIEPIREIESSMIKNLVNNQKDNLLLKLRELKEGNEIEFREYKRFERFVLQLVSDGYKGKKRRIVFPPDGDGVGIGISNDKNVLPLSNYGSGVEQLIIIAANIVVGGISQTVLFEEPEVHLHPELQRKLFHFLKNENGHFNNRYFILSHSSVFINEVVRHGGKVYLSNKISHENTTQMQNITNNGVYSALEEIGARGSDILQSNGIVWVEGPSDRIYINKWLNLCAAHQKKKPLVEGEDFSIMFYGGSLLSWLNVSEDFLDESEKKESLDDFINLIKMNRNVAFIVDKDSEIDKKWKSKERIRNEISTFPMSFYWVTDGKEIENYLSKDLIARTFQEKYLSEKKAKEWIFHGKYAINRGNKPFADYFRSEKDNSLPAKQRPQTFYQNMGKVGFAKKILEKIEPKDFQGNELLVAQVGKLYRIIESWNKS